MTGPEYKSETEQAREEVRDALQNAAAVRDRGAKIGERWKKSREDNNFRQMLRSLGSAVNNAS